MSKADFTETGLFKVAFKLGDGKYSRWESVRYVTPYGSDKAAMIMIPEDGSQVLVAYEDEVAKESGMIRGYYYLGSVMGHIPGMNRGISPEETEEGTYSTAYVDKDKEGLAGPPIGQGSAARPAGGIWEQMFGGGSGPNTPQNWSHWPSRFQRMYDAKGVIPEQYGLETLRGDSWMISNRYKGNKGQRPYQDHRVGFHSGSGKRLELVDSPIVDGIVMTNEHRGKDFFIWSTGLSNQSPFAAGEYHMRTHGPVNLYTLLNRFHIWIEDGLNIEIENKSTSKSAYGSDLHTNPDGRYEAQFNPFADNIPANGLGDPGNGGYYASRAGKFGNETTGCIQLLSHHNNISLSAMEVDSVIHIHAPGPHSKVIVETGGTVDIIADRKITIQSKEEVEINAPLVDINGSDNVYIDGERIDLNLPHPGPEF